MNKSQVVSSLHAILKPFLLRRLKVDVEKELPPKKEYLLYAPLTQQQKDIYQAIVNGSIRQYLVDKKTAEEEEAQPEPVVEEEEEQKPGRKTRKRGKIDYHIEEDDAKYVDDLENGRVKGKSAVAESPAGPVVKASASKQAAKHVNNMRLQNLVMQLRKISSHPFLFDWPVEPGTDELVVNQDLVNASGKMLLLSRLLDALFAKGHRVLLFSQFTTMLDVIVSFGGKFNADK